MIKYIYWSLIMLKIKISFFYNKAVQKGGTIDCNSFEAQSFYHMFAKLWDVYWPTAVLLSKLWRMCSAHGYVYTCWWAQCCRYLRGHTLQEASWSQQATVGPRSAILGLLGDWEMNAWPPSPATIVNISQQLYQLHEAPVLMTLLWILLRNL